MKCKACGKELSHDTKFCTHCGAINTNPLPDSYPFSETIPTYTAESHAGAAQSRKRLVTGLSIVGALILVFGVVFVTTSDNRLENSLEECPNALNFLYASLEDDGSGLFLDGAGEDSFGLPFSTISCVLDVLEVPSLVRTRMSNTNSLMGIQEATFDGIRAQWSYHPNNGFDIYFEYE
jgi:hypothetical protein